MILYQLGVFLHILSAIVWIGGMPFLALVIVPATRGLPPVDRAALFGAVGRRFRTVGWACIVTLLITGTINATYRGVTWENLFSSTLWGSPFGTTLALKLGVVAIMLGLSAYHDFVIGPRSVRLAEAAARHQHDGHGDANPAGIPGTRPGVLAEVQRTRRLASYIGRLEAVPALVVLALAIMLVRGTPFLR